MSAAEIENRIRDTTGQLEASSSSSEQQTVHGVQAALCSLCGKTPISTTGSAALLNKCTDCFADLEKSLQIEEESFELPDRPSDVADDSGAPPVDALAEPLTPAANMSVSPSSGSMTKEAMEGALMLATTDSNKACTIMLNGIDETFVFVHDPVNGSSHRKHFKRMSWDQQFAPLYWYIAFGAIFTSEKFVLTPCIIGLSNSVEEGNILLYAILQTMCNRPRYDGLCVNMRTGAVFIAQGIMSKVGNIILSATFDRSEMDRLIKDFLSKGRWFYEPERGLIRSCKDPQRADTALRKFWTKERLQAEKDGPKPEPAVELPQPTLKPQSRKRGRLSTKHSRKSTSGNKVRTAKKIQKPAAKTVEILSDEATDESENDELPPPPKREACRRKSPKELQHEIISDVQPNHASPLMQQPVLPVAETVMSKPLAAAVPMASAPPAVPSLAEGNAAVIQYAMSAAYDAALLHARSLELDRRERELEVRLRASEEQAAKNRFFAAFSSKLPPFL